MTARSTTSTARSTHTPSCRTPPWPKSQTSRRRPWRGGKFDFDDYLIESLQTGTVEVVDPDEDDHDEYWLRRGMYLYAGREVTHDELRSEVEPEAVGLDREQWIGGEFVFDD